MTIQLNDIIRVTAKMSYGEDDVQNVFHYKCAESGGVDESTFMTAVRDELDAAYVLMEDFIADGISADSVEAWNLTQESWVGEITWSNFTGGQGLGAKMPPSTCPLITFTTGVLGSQGRKYMPFTTEDYNDLNGNPNASIKTAMGLFAAAILNGFQASGIDFIPGNWRKATSTFIPWVTAIIRGYYGIQRRRRVGAGS